MPENQKQYSVNWDTVRQDGLIILLLLLMFAGAAAFLPYLPDPMPSHWNIRGEVDSYTSRSVGAFSMPVMALVIYALMLFLPLIDPKRKNYAQFNTAYRAVRAGLVIFFAVLQAAIFGYAMGIGVRIEKIMPVALGILFIIIGICLKNVKHNYFVGIRTPWTLADEEVWTKTHAFAAPLFAASGVLCILSAFLKSYWSFAITIAAILGASFISIVYSWIAYRQKNRTP